MKYTKLLQLLFLITSIQLIASQQPVNAQAFKVYSWAGTINNKIPVSVWYTMKDNAISGEIVYKKTGKPIQLRGFINHQGDYEISEFQPSGNITGVITGKSKNNEFTGSWHAPGSEQFLSIKLKPIGTVGTTLAKIDPTITTTNYAGTYVYESKDGLSGLLKIKKTSNGQYMLEILNSTTVGQAINDATIEETPITITNGQATYESADFEQCKFKIRFFTDFVVVNYIDNKADCGFGRGTTVEGVYLRKAK